MNLSKLTLQQLNQLKANYGDIMSVKEIHLINDAIELAADLPPGRGWTTFDRAVGPLPPEGVPVLLWGKYRTGNGEACVVRRQGSSYALEVCPAHSDDNEIPGSWEPTHWKLLA